MAASLLLLLAATWPARAQSSASYKVTGAGINGGSGRTGGGYAASASWRVTLDAVGDAALGTGLSSAGSHVDVGTVDVYPPPGEVQHVLFADSQSLSWAPEKSAGRYELYRSALSLLAGGDTGGCLESGLTAASATDASVPSVGQGYFYLVTVRNRLGEEGTKGTRSNGTTRPNPAPCP